jgi:hypothetical protein
VVKISVQVQQSSFSSSRRKSWLHAFGLVWLAKQMDICCMVTQQLYTVWCPHTSLYILWWNAHIMIKNTSTFHLHGTKCNLLWGEHCGVSCFDFRYHCCGCEITLMFISFEIFTEVSVWIAVFLVVAHVVLCVGGRVCCFSLGSTLRLGVICTYGVLMSTYSLGGP